jgi:drug/metabolite transporter (DMT)-like permease
MRLAWLIVLGFLWAARLTAIKAAATSGIDAQAIVSVSVLGIAFFLSAVSMARGAFPPMTRAAVKFYTLSGLLGFIMPFVLENIASPHLPVFVFILIISTMPMITLLLGSASRIEKLRPRQAAAIFLGFMAAVLIAIDMRGGGGSVSGGVIWIAIGFGVPLLYAINTLFIASRWPAGADAVQVGNGQALIMSAAVLLGGITTGGIAGWPAVAGNLPAILGIVVFEALALLVYLRITRDHGAAYVSQANYVSLVFAAVLGFAIFGERLGWLTVLSGLVLAMSLRIGRNRDRPG